MKKTIAALAAVALLALTGCSDEPKSWEDDYDSGSSSSSGESLDERKQELGRSILRDQQSTFRSFSDSQIDRLAAATCSALDTESVDTVFAEGIDVFGPGEMGALISLSSLAYCTEHQTKVQNWMD